MKSDLLCATLALAMGVTALPCLAQTATGGAPDPASMPRTDSDDPSTVNSRPTQVEPKVEGPQERALDRSLADYDRSMDGKQNPPAVTESPQGSVDQKPSANSGQ